MYIIVVFTVISVIYMFLVIDLTQPYLYNVETGIYHFKMFFRMLTKFIRVKMSSKKIVSVSNYKFSILNIRN